MRSSTRLQGRAATIGVAVALVVGVAAGPAAADGVEQLSGTAVFVEECDGRTSDFTMAFDGDLVGCWYMTVDDARFTPSGVLVETGTELFVGCLTVGAEDVCGTMSTAYRFVGKFDESFAEIHGRCQHPLTGGTEGFAGVTGRVDMKDDVETGTIHYRGHVDLAP